MEATERLARVQTELAKYEHPLFELGARLKGEAVELSIDFKHRSLGVHTYQFEFHPRDIEHPQFTWTLVTS